MGEFVSGQQLLSAGVLTVLAFGYQYQAGRLTWEALKENTASVIFPLIWLVCAFGCFYVIKAAIHLHREMVAEIDSYKPTIPDYKPKQPSRVPAFVTSSFAIGILALLSYGTFIVAFPKTTKAKIVTPTPAPSPPPVPAPRPELSSIDGLATLGWTIKPRDRNGQEFQVVSRSLPDMSQSARYFRSLGAPFRIILQAVPSLKGLSALHGISNLKAVTLSYGEYRELDELRGLTSLSSLEISQVAATDLSPLRNLRSLRSLVLVNDDAIKTISPLSGLVNIARLILNHTSISDLAPLRGLTSLKVLDIGDTDVVDFSSLGDMLNLSDLRAGGNHVPLLRQLSTIQHLSSLHLFGFNEPVNLSNVGELHRLEVLDVLTSQALDLSPLRELRTLQNLKIIGVLRLIQLGNVSAIGESTNLRTLTLAGVQLADIGFVAKLVNLESIDISGTEVVDISPLLTLRMLNTLTVIGTPARSDTVALLEQRGVTVRLH